MLKDWFKNLNKKKIAKEAAVSTGSAVGRIIGLALKIVLTVVLIAICTGFLFVLIFSAYVKNTMKEDLTVTLDEFSLNQTSTIYYFDKESQQWEVLERLAGLKGDRQWVDYEDLNPWFEKAAVAIEDKRFYSHHGVDWFRTFGAFYTVFFSDTDDVFGGSTLTQQLLKNVTHYDDFTVKRKLTEIFRALELEKTYTKEQIIEWYLNAVFFGNRCYGVQSAALKYFGKDQSELTAAECACIIGITNNPSAYNPYLHPVANKERQELILREMYDEGYIDNEADYKRFKAQKLTFGTKEELEGDKQRIIGVGGDVTSWYVDAIIEDVIHKLMELKEVDYDTAETLLFNAGYRVYSAIDMGVQDIIDDVYSTFDHLPAGYVKSSSQDLQSAIVVMDPFTGDILGMSGGIGKKEYSRGFNRATQMERSPGSTIKPVASYSICLDKHLVWPWTIFDDSDQVRLNGTSWYPNNDDYGNDGGVTLRYALQVSINTVAAQMVDMLTPEVSFDQLKNKLGMTHMVEPNDVSYSGMALGQLTYGETVREMCQSYTPLCNKGIYTEGRTYYRIEDANGKLVYDNVPESHAALSETTAYYMTDMLCNAVNHGTGYLSKFGSMEIAGKSGGSSSWKDRWYIAYTPYLLAACWTGYDIPQNMGSSNPATGMWKQVMSEVHKYLGYEDKGFGVPEGMKRVTICCDTGLLASEACEHEIRGNRTMSLYMRPEDIPTSICEAHVYTSICKDSMDAVGADCPEASIVKRSVLNPEKFDGELTLPLYFRDGYYPKRVSPDNEEAYRAYKAKLDSATPYVLQELVPCRKHNLDPVTGWIIEYPHGYLINPVTGMYYDTEKDILIDQYSMLQIDWYTGYLIDADTGEFIDPYTGEKVYLTDEELAAYTTPKYQRPPGYGPDPQPVPPEEPTEPNDPTEQPWDPTMPILPTEPSPLPTEQPWDPTMPTLPTEEPTEPTP